MLTHPNARTIVSKLTLPSPIKKYFSQDEWNIDLSNNTNPYVEGFAEYPDVKHENLKNLYLNTIIKLNFSDSLKNEIFSRTTLKNILFTVGSMEGIDILLRTFCEPNKDTIAVVHPTFSAYEHWGLLHNLRVKRIPLEGESLNTFSLREMIKTNPKMVFLCNPNNPIGTILLPGLIEKLCGSIDGFVVVDEAYIEFSDQPSSLQYLNKYKNLIILRTFSKAWGLAGVRCGVILADNLIIHSLRYTQLPFSFSSPSQVLVEKCLLDPEKVTASWQRIKNDRDKVIKELSVLGGIEHIFKSETNFIMLVLKDIQKVLNLLKEHKIQVLDCSMSIPNTIRVSLGTEDQNRKFIEVMHKASSS